MKGVCERPCWKTRRDDITRLGNDSVRLSIAISKSNVETGRADDRSAQVLLLRVRTINGSWVTRWPAVHSPYTFRRYQWDQYVFPFAVYHWFNRFQRFTRNLSYADTKTPWASVNRDGFFENFVHYKIYSCRLLRAAQLSTEMTAVSCLSVRSSLRLTISATRVKCLYTTEWNGKRHSKKMFPRASAFKNRYISINRQIFSLYSRIISIGKIQIRHVPGRCCTARTVRIIITIGLSIALY